VNKRQEKSRIDEIVGKNIVAERKSRNITRDELATALELSPSHMGLIERGGRGLTAINLSRLSKFLDIPIDDLFTSPKTETNKTYESSTQAKRKKIQSLTTCLVAAELDYLIHTITGMNTLNRLIQNRKNLAE